MLICLVISLFVFLVIYGILGCLLKYQCSEVSILFQSCREYFLKCFACLTSLFCRNSFHFWSFLKQLLSISWHLLAYKFKVGDHFWAHRFFVSFSLFFQVCFPLWCFYRYFYRYCWNTVSSKTPLKFFLHFWGLCLSCLWLLLFVISTVSTICFLLSWSLYPSIHNHP